MSTEINLMPDIAKDAFENDVYYTAERMRWAGHVARIKCYFCNFQTDVIH
jgi:hypothetical protein